jgi:hypothetical protein
MYAHICALLEGKQCCPWTGSPAVCLARDKLDDPNTYFVDSHRNFVGDMLSMIVTSYYQKVRHSKCKKIDEQDRYPTGSTALLWVVYTPF